MYDITFYVYSLFPLSVGLAFNNSSCFLTSLLLCFSASLLLCPVPHTPACQGKVVQRPVSYAGIFLLVLYWPVVDRLFPAPL